MVCNNILLILCIVLIIVALCFSNDTNNKQKEEFSGDGARVQLQAKDPQDLYLTQDAHNYIPIERLNKFAPKYDLVDENGWVDYPFFRIYPTNLEQAYD